MKAAQDKYEDRLVPPGLSETLFVLSPLHQRLANERSEGCEQAADEYEERAADLLVKVGDYVKHTDPERPHPLENVRGEFGVIESQREAALLLIGRFSEAVQQGVAAEKERWTKMSLVSDLQSWWSMFGKAFPRLKRIITVLFSHFVTSVSVEQLFPN